MAGAEWHGRRGEEESEGKTGDDSPASPPAAGGEISDPPYPTGLLLDETIDGLASLSLAIRCITHLLTDIADRIATGGATQDDV